MVNNPRIVVTLTTLPRRIEQLTILESVLQSLNNQTVTPDAIYLSIPERASRLNQIYPTIPQSIANLCTIVKVPYDFGPVTKLYGGLSQEQDDSTMIISCDDDIIYPLTLIEELVTKSQTFPNQVIASAGAIIGSFPCHLSFAMNQSKHRNSWWFSTEINPISGTLVDIVCGYAGILYRRSFFPASHLLESDFFSIPLRNNHLFLHDDIYISCYLNSKNVDRRVFIVSDVENCDGNLNSLSSDMLSFGWSFIQAINYCHRQKWIIRKQSLSLMKSLTGPIIITIIIAIIVIIILIWLYKHKR